jgi:hypothetical protein
VGVVGELALDESVVVVVVSLPVGLLGVAFS